MADLHAPDNYEQCVFSFSIRTTSLPLPFFSMKRVAAAWRISIGVWAPKKWEYSLTALSQYIATPILPANQWITNNNGASGNNVMSEPPVTLHPYRAQRPRSGRMMRHVLRARAEAVCSLAS
jgi:glycerol-3-phosphate O-acyltransferase / dihydroxyacetone phosphate acyltransferase